MCFVLNGNSPGDVLALIPSSSEDWPSFCTSCGFGSLRNTCLDADVFVIMAGERTPPLTYPQKIYNRGSLRQAISFIIAYVQYHTHRLHLNFKGGFCGMRVFKQPGPKHQSPQNFKPNLFNKASRENTSICVSMIQPMFAPYPVCERTRKCLRGLIRIWPPAMGTRSGVARTTSCFPRLYRPNTFAASKRGLTGLASQ